MDSRIAKLLAHPALYLGSGERLADRPTQSTGHPDLDALLPGGGWPKGKLTEILTDAEAVGELSLLMPVLAAFSRKGRWIAWICPPNIPYPPALVAWGVDLVAVLVVRAQCNVDMLWSAERALASGVCGAVLAWPREIDLRQLRRLQLAAERGGACGFLFRSAPAATQPSPAAIRLTLRRTGHELQVKILKGLRFGSIRSAVISMRQPDVMVEHSVA